MTLTLLLHYIEDIADDSNSHHNHSHGSIWLNIMHFLQIGYLYKIQAIM